MSDFRKKLNTPQRFQKIVEHMGRNGKPTGMPSSMTQEEVRTINPDKPGKKKKK